MSERDLLTEAEGLFDRLPNISLDVEMRNWEADLACWRDRLKALLVSPVGKQEENLAPNPATSQNGAEGFGFAWKLPSGEEFRAMWFLDGAVVISLFAASDPDGTLSRGSVRIPPKVIPDLVAFLTSAPAGSTI